MYVLEFDVHGFGFKVNGSARMGILQKHGVHAYGGGGAYGRGGD